MKTIGTLAVIVASGVLGGILLLRYCKKKKKCGCGCGDAASDSKPALSTPGIVADNPPVYGQIKADPSPALMAADGSGGGGWVKQPKQW